MSARPAGPALKKSSGSWTASRPCFGQTIEIITDVGPQDRDIVNPSDSLVDGMMVAASEAVTTQASADDIESIKLALQAEVAANFITLRTLDADKALRPDIIFTINFITFLKIFLDREYQNIYIQ
jgi:hypothetical protein